jgi:hypothetical protein
MVCEAGPRYYKHNKLKKGKFSMSASTSNGHHSPLHYKACIKAKKKQSKLIRKNMRYPTYLGSGY